MTEAHPRIQPSPMTEPGPNTVLLLGCVKTQRDHASPAEELFCSPLFAARRRYAERRAQRWFILSSAHGLLRPEQLAEPYDLPLASQEVAYRRRWAHRVLGQLRAELGMLAGVSVEFHAGAAHADLLAAALRPAGAQVTRPLRGLSLGRQLAWYRADQAELTSR